VNNLIFQQLYEKESSTFSYLLADADSLEGVIIDPVLETVDRDLKLIEELGIKLLFVLETHVHADHITGAAKISDATGAKIGLSKTAEAKGAHLLVQDGDEIKFGRQRLRAIATPGHTDSCMCYLLGDRLFTGDTLTIRGNGRTDFQQGSAVSLYKNIHEKLFTLPDDTRVFPAHDYKGFTSSTIGAEKKFNIRLGGGRTLKEFVQIMSELKLAQPQKIEIAVPANLKCGRSSN